MSQNITQNNIIMWLEDVVPQMQKSADPTGCLLKYASDHNFTPAILERVGHMFNSLKTNSAYNMAKEASHRGDYISTLDVPALVDEYTKFSHDIKGKPIVSSLEAFNQAIPLKKVASASSDNEVKIGKIEDLANKKLAMQGYAPKKEMTFKFQQEDKAVALKKTAGETDTFNPEEVLNSCRDAKDAASREMIGAYTVLTGISNKFASQFSTKTAGEHITFDKIEHAAVLSHENYDLCKEAMEHMANMIKSHSVYLKNTIKTASETGLYAKYKITKGAPACMDLINDYVEAYDHYKQASEAYNELDKMLKNSTFDLLNYYNKANAGVLKVATVADPDVDVDVDVDVEEEYKPKERPKKKPNQTQTDYDNEVEDWKRDEKREREAWEQKKKDRQRQKEKEEERKYNDKIKNRDIARENAKRDEERVYKEDQEYAKALRESVNSALKTVTDSLGGSIKDIVSATREGISGAKEKMSELYKAIDTARALKAKNWMVSPILKKVKDVEDAATLQQLLFTDPILSKLSADETERLMEVYNSLVSHNPDIGSDKGLLRSVLRMAVASGGIDLGAIETASKINKLQEKAEEGKKAIA